MTKHKPIPTRTLLSPLPVPRERARVRAVLCTAILLFLSPFFLSPARADGTIIIVVGAEGTPEYGREFTTWADRWAQSAALGSERVIKIGRDNPPTTPPSIQPTTSPTTDKERLQALLQSESKEPKEPLWLVLIGHGTSDGPETKFNLRGPDVSDLELAEWLRPMKRPLAVIDCSSASSPFLNHLSGKGRVIITATRSSSEIQFAHFGEYLSTAIADPAADLDKDGQTSLLEAFLAASHQVDEFYKQNGRVVTEHALLDDNGDALGISADWFTGTRATHSARNGAPLDGARASRWSLIKTAAELAISPELRTRRDDLELQIESLRGKKTTMPESAYYAQLDDLFLKLARVYQQIDK